MKGDRESLQTEGFDDYMAKPIDIKELPRVVERHLRGRL
jgi:DNA-binding response OmpR family regulator